MGTEELDFLKGELKKINTQIEELQYGSDAIYLQGKLWELRDKIKGEINELTHVSEKGKVF